LIKELLSINTYFVRL